MTNHVRKIHLRPRSTRAELVEIGEYPSSLTPSYNIAPTQEVADVIAEDEKRKLEMLRWGLDPSWAEYPTIGNRMINARAETVSEKPAFRKPFRMRRCLVLTDGFYEWQKTYNGKQPFYTHIEDGLLRLCCVVGDLEWRRRRGPLLHHPHP